MGVVKIENIKVVERTGRSRKKLGEDLIDNRMEFLLIVVRNCYGIAEFTSTFLFLFGSYQRAY